MANPLCSFVLGVYSLLFQIFSPCSTPNLLPANSLNSQEYLGKWYFIAAASQREADIHSFRWFDSTVFTLEETSVENTLLLTGHIRIGDHCKKATWTYHIRPEREDLELEERLVRRNLIWSGDWLNCSQCILLQEVEPPVNQTATEDSLNRFMLYARQSDVDAEVVKEFETKSACHGMKAFVSLPQKKEFCI